MGLFSFVKDAGQALFGKDDDDEKGKADLADVLERRRESQLAAMVQKIGIPAENIAIDLKGDTVTITGQTQTQEDREKIVLLIGNTVGVAKVDDRLVVTGKVAQARPTWAAGVRDQATFETTEGGAAFHTVVRGDTLSAIAKRYYGSAGKHPVIFEANRPLLADPDKIYPGQVLRIPPQG